MFFKFSDATSTGDAVALQNRLQNLNTGLESGLQDLTQYNGLPVVPGSHRFISGQQNNYQNGKFKIFSSLDHTFPVHLLFLNLYPRG